MVRQSNKTYYGGKGRFKDNQSPNSSSGSGGLHGPYIRIPVVPSEEFVHRPKQNKKVKNYKFRCICEQEMFLIDNCYPIHNQLNGDYCSGSGKIRYFWYYQKTHTT